MVMIVVPHYEIVSIDLTIRVMGIDMYLPLCEKYLNFNKNNLLL
jgi:hypothetical protein